MPRKNDTRGINSLQVFLLSLIVGLTPLVFSTATLDPVMVPRMLLLSLLTLLLLVSLARSIRKEGERQVLSIFRRRIFVIAAIFIFVTVLSSIKSTLPGESIFEILKSLVPYILLCLFALVFSRRREMVKVVARLISIVALALSIVGAAQYFGFGFLWIPGNHVPYATMANKNLLSSFLFLSLPWSIIVLPGSLRFWRLLSILSVSMSLFLIVVGRTRAVWVALFLAAIVSLILLILMERQARRNDSKERFISRKTIIRLAAGLALGLGSAYLVGELSPGQSLLDRVESIVKAEDASVRDRLGIWSRSLEIVAHDPILGVGPGQWRVHIAGYGTAGLRSEAGIIHFQRPHNDYLWIASESGIPALLCFIAFLTIGLVYCRRIIFGSSERQERIQAMLLLLGLIGFMVISFFSYPRERLVHMTCLMLMIGLVTSMYHRQHPMAVKPGRIMTTLLWPVAAVVLVGAAVAAYSRIESEKHINRAYLYQERNNWAGMINEIDRAHTFLTPMDPTATPLMWYRGLANFSLNRIDAAMVDFQKAHRVNPNHLHVLTNLGTVYEMKGDHDSAVRYYRRALEISPRFEDAALNLTAVYYNGGEYQKAYETISRIRASSTDPRYRLYFDKVKQELSIDSTEY